MVIHLNETKGLKLGIVITEKSYILSLFSFRDLSPIRDTPKTMWEIQKEITQR